MQPIYQTGDVVRLQYRTNDLPFLAVVTSIEDRPGYRYVHWTRQFRDLSALGGYQAYAGQFGAFRDGEIRVLHP